jgi:hypothetical protein
MFNITTSRQFFEKLLEEQKDLNEDRTSARHALNCIITAYHLHEWIWGDWLKDDFEAWRALGIRDKDSFVAWLDGRCYWFSVFQELANGAKHFIRDTHEVARLADGWGSGPFGIGPFGHPYLYVDFGDDKEPNDRYRTVTRLVDEAVAFWRGFIDEYHPTQAA